MACGRSTNFFPWFLFFLRWGVVHGRYVGADWCGWRRVSLSGTGLGWCCGFFCAGEDSDLGLVVSEGTEGGFEVFAGPAGVDEEEPEGPEGTAESKSNPRVW